MLLAFCGLWLGLVGSARADVSLTLYGYVGPYISTDGTNGTTADISVRVGARAGLSSGLHYGVINGYAMTDQGWAYDYGVTIGYIVGADGNVSNSEHVSVGPGWSQAQWETGMSSGPPLKQQFRIALYDSEGVGHEKVLTTVSMGNAITFHPPDVEAYYAACAEVIKESFEVDPTPCSSCSCEPGSSTCADNSIDYQLNLGRGNFGIGQGALSLHAQMPSPYLAQPAGLTDDIQDPACQTIYRNSALRQVLATQCLVDVQTLSAYKYQIAFYHRLTGDPQVGDGTYQVGGTPFKTVTVENPDASALLYNRVLITETATGASAQTIEYDWHDADQNWEMITGNGLRHERLATVIDAATGDKLKTRTILNAAGQPVTKKLQRFHSYSRADEMISETLDPDGAALTTTWNYYDTGDTTPGAFTGKLQQKVNSSGSWERYEYNGNGQESKHVTSFLDAPLGSADAACRVVTTSYADANPIQTAVETLQGVEVGRRYEAVTADGQVQEIVCQQVGAAWDAPGNLVTTRRLDGTGQILREQRPDGTLTLGTYTPAGNQKTSVVAVGAPSADGSTVVDGTLTTTVVDPSGNQLLQTVQDLASGLTLSSDTATQTDAVGRPTQVTHADGSTETTSYGCCGVDARTDRDGNTVTYNYDALKRMVSETQAGVTSLYTLDADGRRLVTTRQGSDGSRVTVERLTYDVAGRQTSRTDALGRTTTFAETIQVPTLHTVRTTTLPDPTRSTRVETSSQDGSLLSVGGTAAHPLLYAYGADATLGAWRQETRVGDGGAASEWTMTYTDAAGREYRTLTAAGAVSQSFFNAQGQLVRSADPDGVTTLFGYNARGEQDTVAVDLEGNGQIDLAGTDRVTRTARTVLSAHNTTVTRTTASAWTTNGQDAPAVVGVDDQSADGRSAWHTDAGGLTTTSVTACDGAGGCTTTLTAPDGSAAVSVTGQGRALSQTRLDAHGQSLSGTTMDYDPQGRLWHQSDRRDGATEFTYDDADQLRRVSHQGQTTGYGYDALGRKTLETEPDLAQVQTEYWPTGEVKSVGGARTYPQGYTYDTQGRLQTLTTTGAAGAEVTTWHYDAQSGQMVFKAYADGKGPSYTYTSAGRLATRTWARGIVTTYGHDAAGQLASISYSDGATPAAAYTYDRLGRLASASGGGSARALAYQGNTSLLTSESYTAGPLAGVAVNTGYDALLRRTGLQVNQGQTSLVTQSFGFDAASRLASASQGTAGAAYSYYPDSAANLVQSITFTNNASSSGSGNSSQPVMTTTKTYDLLDRLINISSTVAGASAPVSGYNYTYNLANQRIRADVAADGTHLLYGYDALGQVTGASRRWADDTLVAGQQFGYGYDQIGNRTNATTNGRQSLYTSNLLNQDNQRTVPGAVDVTGTASPSATVTLNQQPVTRQSSGYFAGNVSVDNSQAAIDVSVDVVTAVTGGSTGGMNTLAEQKGKIFLPQTPERFSYDLDGNLKQDGRWTYTWDGENQLVHIEALGSLPTDERKKLTFSYDDAGRRIQKQVWVWNISGNSYISGTNTLFAYDGWNFVAELDGMSNGVLEKSYLWGTDLSGSLQLACGVGGLLAITRNTQNSNLSATALSDFVCCDGNNVATLIAAQDGSVSADYQYNPFGEIVKMTGIRAEQNPVRFGGKYYDEEINLIYYTLRFYNPQTGTFISRDPTQEQGGIDVYAICRNDLLNRVDPFGLDDTSAYGLGWQWVQGGNDKIFVDGDRMTEQLKSTPEIKEVRQELAQILSATHCGEPIGDVAASRSLRYSGYWANAYFVVDFIDDLFRNPTRAFLGSFDGHARILNVDCCTGIAAVQFYVTNVSGGVSASHLPFWGYSPRSDGSLRPTLPELWNTPLPTDWVIEDLIPRSLFSDNNSGSGAFHSITQDFHWREQVQFKSDNQNQPTFHDFTK